jgi:hypothetical protein
MTLWLPFQNTYLHNPRTVVEQTILRYAHFLQRFVTTKRTHQDINLNMVVRRPGKVCGDCADLSVVLVLLTPNACSYNIMYWIWGLRTNPGILFHMITHGPNHKTNKAKSIYHNNCQKQNTDMNTEGELTGVVASTETSRGPGSTTRAYGFPSGPRTGHPPTPSTPWTSGVGNSPFYKL